MPNKALVVPEPQPTEVPVAPPVSSRPSVKQANDNVYLLQRTQALVNDRPADAQYWTAYDYFMLEREARAVRRAYLSGLITAMWTRWRKRLAALRLTGGADRR